MNNDKIEAMLALYSPQVKELVDHACRLIRELIPDAAIEVNEGTKIIAFSFIPHTYRGIAVAIALQQSYINLQFVQGTELADFDSKALLEGTGKHARHVRVDSLDVLQQPAVRALIEASAKMTPRA